MGLVCLYLYLYLSCTAFCGWCGEGIERKSWQVNREERKEGRGRKTSILGRGREGGGVAKCKVFYLVFVQSPKSKSTG